MGFLRRTLNDGHFEGEEVQSEGIIEEVAPFLWNEATRRKLEKGIPHKVRSASLPILLTIIVALMASGITFWITAEWYCGACNSTNDLWSPAEEQVEYFDLDIDNDFAAGSRYRGPPTPELDAAWEELWHFGYVAIPRDKLSALNRQEQLPDGRTVARINGSTDHFQASLEVFHQLHCLDVVRQHSWAAYYARHTDTVRTPADLKVSPVGLRMHVDHCIETLRKTIMCQSDVTPLLIINDPTKPDGCPDFSAFHRCRKFHRVWAWMKRNQRDVPRRMDHTGSKDHSVGESG
ncbi:hypothetical protein AYO21_00310 [Fonsecaea monophora]|uniref:Cyclochlorotine biosynthesis protein O n=1 Tax=Fonsecaea monophora TaxID=254056 RepID=A0A177FMX8_9EURO|nr:hypothetical protein AYO21_00310 [Fonsecaea monophora]OAG45674.1 hypothetical protein AYO21_00310 [Fonsecaea monophora]